MNLFKLISIEHFKMWKRFSVRIMCLLVIAAAIGYCGLAKYVDNRNNPKHTAVTDVSDWREQAEQQVKVLPAAIKGYQNSKSIEAKMLIGYNQMQLAEARYRLAHNIAPKTGSTSVWGWMIKLETGANISDYPAFVTLIALCAVIFVTACIAGEFTEGTMKMMISRPFARGEILSAKLAASVLYMLELFGIFIVILFLGLGILFGFGDLGAKDLLWTGNQLLYVPAVVKLLALYGLNLLSLLFYIIFAFFLSTLFRSRSLATGVSIFVLLIGNGICLILLMFFNWAKYIAFGLSPFTLFLTNGNILPDITLGFSLILCGIYAAAFLVAGYFTFLKRDI